MPYFLYRKRGQFSTTIPILFFYEKNHQQSAHLLCAYLFSLVISEEFTSFILLISPVSSLWLEYTSLISAVLLAEDPDSLCLTCSPPNTLQQQHQSLWDKVLLDTAHCFLQQTHRMDDISEAASTMPFNVSNLLQSNWKAVHKQCLIYPFYRHLKSYTACDFRTRGRVGYNFYVCFLNINVVFQICSELVLMKIRGRFCQVLFILYSVVGYTTHEKFLEALPLTLVKSSKCHKSFLFQLYAPDNAGFLLLTSLGA